MFHPQHADFIESIHNQRKIRIRYHSRESKQIVTRDCIPIDYGPDAQFADKISRYQIWDTDSDGAEGPKRLFLVHTQLIDLAKTEDTFDPSDFVTWTPVMWQVPRDWGQFS